MPGSGKSTLGKQLAEKLEWGFLDLDDLIEKMEGRKISQIFDQDGEDRFREIEKERLDTLLDVDGDLVISCGGGTPCFYDNMRRMNESGITVFLDTSLEVLLERTKNETHRPLLEENKEEKLTKLLKNRLPFYRQAEIQLKDKAINVDRLIQLLDRKL